MSKQWKQAWSMQNNANEDHLLALCEDMKRLNYQMDEDFVRVNLAEVEQGDTIREDNTEYQSPLDSSSSNFVLSRIEYSSSKKEPADQSDCDSDVPKDEDKLEAHLIDQCPKHNVKLSQIHKRKYPKPNWMKMYERGVYSIKKSGRENKNCSEQKNKLFSKMNLDPLTTQVLESLIHNRYLGQINELVYKGKNSTVFHAYCNRNNCIVTPYDIAVKIYNISKDEEKNEIIFKKVQKEFEHINILHHSRKVGDQSIWPLTATKHVILLGFVGSEFLRCGIVADPFEYNQVGTIEDFPFEYNQAMYNIIVDYIDNCYNITNLVHGRLSSKKILYWISYEGIPVFRLIGWSNSIKRKHPMALPKLMRDCHFVTEFFKRKGVAVKSTIKLFKQITRTETVERKLLDKFETNPNRQTTSPKPSTNRRFK